MSNSLYRRIGDGTIKGDAIKSLAKYDFGTVALSRLVLGGSVADQDTFTVGEDTYEIHRINTDTGADANAMTATTGLLSLKSDVTDVSAGDVLRIGSEYILIRFKNDDDEYVVDRGYAGSTAAAHANNSNVYQAAQAPGDGNLPVPVGATLTGATAEPLIVAAVNYWQTGHDQNLGPGSGLRKKSAVPGLEAQADGSGNGVYLLLRGGAGTDCAETFTNSGLTIDSEFGTEHPPFTAQKAVVVEALTADSATQVHRFAFPFDVKGASVTSYNASSAAVTSNGPTLAVDGKIVTVTEGSTAYVTGGNLVVEAYGA